MNIILKQLLRGPASVAELAEATQIGEDILKPMAKQCVKTGLATQRMDVEEKQIIYIITPKGREHLENESVMAAVDAKAIRQYLKDNPGHHAASSIAHALGYADVSVVRKRLSNMERESKHIVSIEIPNPNFPAMKGAHPTIKAWADCSASQEAAKPVDACITGSAASELTPFAEGCAVATETPEPEAFPSPADGSGRNVFLEPELQYLAPEDCELPPADPVLLAKANVFLHGELSMLRLELENEKAHVAKLHDLLVSERQANAVLRDGISVEVTDTISVHWRGIRYSANDHMSVLNIISSIQTLERAAAYDRGQRGAAGGASAAPTGYATAEQEE